MRRVCQHLYRAFSGFVIAITLISLISIFLAQFANAAETTSYTATLTATTAGGLTPVLKLPARSMAAGDKLLVTARLAGKTNAVRMPRMAIRVDATGAATLRSPVGAINHLGKASGTQYVTVRWLLVAPVDGTYVITARAEATTYVAPIATTRLAVVRDSTYLKVSPAPAGSVQWGEAAKDCVGRKAITAIPQCKVARTLTTAVPKVVNVARSTKTTVLADLELSREYGNYPRGISMVDITLGATPASTSGKACAATVKKTVRRSIISTRHHWRENLTLTDLKTTCGTHLRVSATVKHVSGNPVTIENQTQTNAIALVTAVAA
ncbi:MAG: hypothetical protein ACRDP8_16405 [Actinopolymorphaceae bacterium]